MAIPDVQIRSLHGAARRMRMLDGPPQVRVGTHFRGEPALTLRCITQPMNTGHVEARTVYANVCASRQSYAILRQATWDAAAARFGARQSLETGTAWPTGYPARSVHYVWTDKRWLQEIALLFDSLSSLRQAPAAIPATCKIYGLEMRRSDGRLIEAVWDEGTRVGIYRVFTAAWEIVWQQMTDLLQSNEPASPDESWCASLASPGQPAARPVGLFAPDSR